MVTGTYLNVIFKNSNALICRQGTGKWVNEFEERKDPHNRSYYWITGYFKSMDNGSYDTDNHVLTEDMVSIVPIKTDMTDHQFIENLKNWKI